MVVKRAIRGQGVAAETPSKVKLPEPKSFAGTRSAKDLENVLWDMEPYFKAAHISEGEKVTITSMYLTGDAKLWWRTQMDNDETDSGRAKIELWETLKELKDQFLPCKTA
ncbi:hypothetical protein CFOL_v3_07848 [Cephalotus follicularis]|uniref:Retrotransposon gag domain-containing protein n=1 Tax=Cephalotus follicularis TaxID=3775 RepID=A0A1Q3B8N8_CEPFO|nr:hypothetical protein CFOL_v3_07848 [Cephalotus follicularis]